MDVVTRRLRVRDLIVEDRDAMVEVWTDVEVARFMGTFGPRTAEEADAWLAETIAANNEADRRSHNCAMVRQATGDVVGWIGFGPSSRPVAEVDFGYAVRAGFRRRGYATEALTAVLDFCLSVLGLRSVWGECDGQNSASARVMEAAGMTRIADHNGDQRFLALGENWLAAKRSRHTS